MDAAALRPRPADRQLVLGLLAAAAVRGGLVLRSARVPGAQWFYLAYSSIEILLCGVIVWLAWRWPKLH